MHIYDIESTMQINILVFNIELVNLYYYIKAVRVVCLLLVLPPVNPHRPSPSPRGWLLKWDRTTRCRTLDRWLGLGDSTHAKLLVPLFLVVSLCS
jgi:hypothetical protein